MRSGLLFISVVCLSACLSCACTVKTANRVNVVFGVEILRAQRTLNWGPDLNTARGGVGGMMSIVPAVPTHSHLPDCATFDAAIAKSLETCFSRDAY